MDERYFFQASLRRIPSMSGNGEVSFSVFAFLSRRSVTVRSLGGISFVPVPGFVRSSIGDVFLA